MARENVIYGLVESLKQVSGLDEVSQGTVVAYDDRILASGVSRAVIVTPDTGQGERTAGRRGQATPSLARYTWQLAVSLYTRDTGDPGADGYGADQVAGSITQRVLSDPTLGGSVLDALVTGTRVLNVPGIQAGYQLVEFGGIPYYLEVLTVSAIEDLRG